MGASNLRGLSILLAVAGPAAGQTPGNRGPIDPGPPSLHLSATETSKMAPDELVATLSAMGTRSPALPAQQQVNALVAQTKAVTDKARGLKTAFQGYSVNFIDEKPTHWSRAISRQGEGGERRRRPQHGWAASGSRPLDHQPRLASLTSSRRKGIASGDHRGPSQVARRSQRRSKGARGGGGPLSARGPLGRAAGGAIHAGRDADDREGCQAGSCLDTRGAGHHRDSQRRRVAAHP